MLASVARLTTDDGICVIRDAAALGERVKALREAAGLEQVELAEQARLSRAYISRLENGGILNPKLYDLSRVAAALSTTVSHLIEPPSPEGGADIANALMTRFGPDLGQTLVRLDRILALMEHGDTAALSVLVANTAEKYERSRRAVEDQEG